MSELLTIMIPCTYDRIDMFYYLASELRQQIVSNGFQNEVKIIWEFDNREISVGAKRQKLLERAEGEFVVGFDSDDFPAPTYVFDIVTALKLDIHKDHVGFIEDCDIDGIKSKSIFSMQFQSWDDKAEGYDQVRCANPKSVIRRTKALEVGFEDMRFGEDRIFSEKVTPLLLSEIFIDKSLYYYRHNSKENIDRYGLNQYKEANIN